VKKLLIGSAAAALVVAMAPAFAQPAPPPPPGVAPGTAVPPVPSAEPRMHMMVMSDRVMTRDEVVRHVSDLFARLDSNRDGFVTRDEMEALHQKMAGMMGMGHDMAKRFSAGGMPMPGRAAMFDRLDANHDGVLSRQEYMAARPQVREEQRVMILRDGPDGAPPAHGAPGMRMRMHDMGRDGMGMGMHGFGGHLFEMADSNHDGRVSLAEAQAAALAHFDRADLNHDGRITPDERQQAHQMMHEHRPS